VHPCISAYTAPVGIRISGYIVSVLYVCVDEAYMLSPIDFVSVLYVCVDEGYIVSTVRLDHMLSPIDFVSVHAGIRGHILSPHLSLL
jgi:hypothetical protein